MFKLTKFQSHLTMLFNLWDFYPAVNTRSNNGMVIWEEGWKDEIYYNVNLIWVFMAHQDYFNHFELSQPLGGPIGDPREKDTSPSTSRTWLVE